MAFFDFLDGLGLDGDCWLLAERGALRRSLVRELAARPAAGPGVLALTLEQAARRLVQGASEPFLLLERGEPVLLAWLLLERHSGVLPYFQRFVEEGRRAVRGVAAPVAEALRRLAALPQPPTPGKGRSGDLARLLGYRREWLAVNGAGEMVDLYRWAAELLRSGALEPPESVVLCFPAFLGPTELEFLRALAGRTRLLVVHEDDERRVFAAVPSTAFSSPTARELAGFAETNCGEPPADERLALVSWLYDDGEKPVPPVGIHPWAARDRADEVVRVVREIKRRAVSQSADGGADLSRYQIVVPRKEPYVGLLAAELAARGLPYSMPSGEPLAATAPAQVLVALLDYLQHPGRDELFAYWGHPAVSPPKLPDKEAVRMALHELTQRLPEPPPGEDPREFWFAEEVEGNLEPLDFDKLARFARVTGLPRRPDIGTDTAERLKQGWLLPLCNNLSLRRPRDGAAPGEWRDWAEETRRRLFELAALMEEETSLDQLRQGERPVAELVSLLREELKLRNVYRNLVEGALTHLKLSTGEGDPVFSVTERRRIEAVTRAWNELEGALDAVGRVARFGESELVMGLTGLEELRRLVEGELAARSVRVPGPDTGVAVFELTDAVGPLGEVFLLGLTNEDFPPPPTASLLPEELRRAEPDSRERAVHHLCRLLLRSPELWLCYPSSDDRGENRPAPPLADLFHLYGGGCRPPGGEPGSSPTCPAELAAVSPEHPELPASLRRAIGWSLEHLEKRAAEEPTAYDGLVDAGLCAGISPERKVTELEDYLDCPRRFFLAHVLGLRRPPEVLDEVERDVVGRLAHRALELFFAGRPRYGLEPWSGGLIGEGNWGVACERMLKAAELAFLDEGLLAPSSIPSPRHQVLNGLENAPAPLDAQRRELVDGLATPGETRTPAGVLRGALEIQRDAIGTLPARVEYGFGGHGQDTPLQIGELVLRGRVDRVDYEAGLLSVYDYKTGAGYPSPADVRKGRTVQLALYALAALENIAEEAPPRVRAAVVALKNRHLPPDDPEYIHLEKGVLVEQVALLQQKNNRTLAYEMARYWLDEAKNTAQSAWVGIIAGRFHLPEEWDGGKCEHCKFADLCGEDPFARRVAKAAHDYKSHA